MLLPKELIAYLSKQLVGRLAPGCMEISNPQTVGEIISGVIIEELEVEDKLNDEVREILSQYSEYNAAYNDILKKLGQGFGAILPRNVVGVKNLETPSGGRSSDPHSALADACDAAQSIRVLGATLTAKIGNVGSFAASSTHADTKYSREEADARRLWSTVRSDLLSPMVYFNARAIAQALNDAGYPCTPDMVLRRVPRGMHRIPREIDPTQKATIVDMALNKWGLKVGMEDLYAMFDLPEPKGPEDVAPGQATQVTSGGALVGAVQASNKGAEAPQPPQGQPVKVQPAKTETTPQPAAPAAETT